MDTGLVLAIFSSLSFAAGIVMVRKTAGEAGESFNVTAISIFTGVPFFAIAIFISGEWSKLLAISWKAAGLLAATGVIHFIIGRLLGYNSFRTIGANRAMPFIMTNPVVTILLSLVFLKEKITAYIVLGFLFMLAGVFLISQEKRRVETKAGDNIKGILLALGAALFWGLTPVLIKPSVEEIGSSAGGSFVSYVTAAVVMGLLYMKRERRARLRQLSLKKSLLPMAVAAVFTAGGQLLLYSALEYSPASIVTPLLSMQIPFVFCFSWLLNRRIEVFTVRVMLGMAATVAGTFLLFR